MNLVKRHAPPAQRVALAHAQQWGAAWCLLAAMAAFAQPSAPRVLPFFPPEVQVIEPLPVAVRITPIDPTTEAPAQVLVAALKAGRSVTLCNVDINMTGISQVELNAGQSIRAQEGCERSSARRGPRIYVTDKRDGGVALFILRDSNTALSGFRLEGPNPGIGSGTQNREYGIQVAPQGDSTPPASGTQTHLLHDVRINNMEVFHWSGAGIDLADNQAVHPQGRMTLDNAAGVTVADNYIHHNRHYAGFGYGVNVGKGAYALVRGNVFEQNRHAMAGDSVSDDKRDHSGYVFQDNLILPGGGLHCREGTFRICWQTHQIDMHGTQSNLTKGQHCCGTAGETVLIERNTILYRGGYRTVKTGPTPREHWAWGLAIKIRGNPKGRARVDGNVFALPNKGSAIAQNGDGALGQNITNPVQVTQNNLWDARPMDTLKPCDFDGNGANDDFMATGVSWWVRSAATQQWRFLSTKTETMGTLVLQDMNGDGQCDVALKPRRPGMTPQHYSARGTGPWQAVHLVVQ